MKRAQLAATAAALLSLTACSSQAAAPDASPDSRASQRFVTLWGEAGDSLTLPRDQAYENSSDANQVYNLTGDSPVHFEAYYFPKPTHGYWCAVSDDDTFITEITDGAKRTVLMGDGGCSTDEADAAVVGDYRSTTWIKGADLMDGEQMKPWGTRTVVIQDQPHEDVLDATAAINLAIMADFARTGAVTTPKHLADVLDAEKVDLPAHVRPFRYTVHSAAKAAFTLCVVNDHTGDWARFDSTQGGLTDSGAKATDFGQVCAT